MATITYYANAAGSSSIDAPVPVFANEALTETLSASDIYSASIDNTMQISVMGGETIFAVSSVDENGIITAYDEVPIYFGPSAEGDKNPPKFVFGSHETGASIVDAIINNTPQTADLVKTFTIAEAVGAVFGSNDENNVHNIRDVYAKNVDNMAWVKGEIDPKTKGPGDRNWHPDETEDSSAEGEGSSSSRA